MAAQQGIRPPNDRATAEERCRTGQVLDGNIKLAELAERRLRDYGEKQLKARTLAAYQALMPRVLAAMGHIRPDKLRPNHLPAFYANLGEPGVRMDIIYRSKGDFKAELPAAKTAFAEQAGGTRRAGCAHERAQYQPEERRED